MRGCQAVVHLAAFGSVIESIADPDENFSVNAEGTLRVLEAARDAKVEKLIFASTGGALVGDSKPPVTENSPPRPKSPYGASKLVGEGYCCAFAGSYGLNTVMLRFGNIYGPVSAHKKGAVTVFAKALMKNEPLVIYGDGNASRDYLHVDDLCEGIGGALATDLSKATVLHLSTGKETSVQELADTLCGIAGKPNHPVRYEPGRRGEVTRNFASFDAARELIGFIPATTLSAGMQATWDWYRAQGEKVFSFDVTDS
jgi:UDP-glucose 4-epimerase